MCFRVFTPEEVAVFYSVIRQREHSDRDDDCIVYLVTSGQKTLQSTGEAAKYGIGPPEQKKIIRSFANDGIIDADWVTTQDGQSATGLELAHHDENWMWKNFGASLIPINDNYDDYFFIQISFDRIREVRENCVAEHLCELFYDEDQCCFCVNCKSTNEIYYIKRLRDTMKPFKILLAAFNSAHKHATRAWLNTNRTTYVGKKSIATRVFAKKSVVRNELSPFVILNAEDVSIKAEAVLTFNQLKALEKA